MKAFDCLYFLENFYLYIIEVKRTGMAENVTAGEKYIWLRIEKDSHGTSRLHFRSKDSSGEIEERYFDEGFLKFNSEIGTYIEKYNSAQHPLKNIGCRQLPEQMEKAVMDFLISMPEVA